MLGRQLSTDAGDVAVLNAFDDDFEASPGAPVGRRPHHLLPLPLFNRGEVRSENSGVALPVFDGAFDLHRDPRIVYKQ